MSKKELVNLYNNARKYKGITEEERELVVQKIESKIRVSSPSVATRMFGPKDSHAREFLQTILNQISEEFDLSGNRVGQAVKTGGDMISGQHHVDVYFSYKNDDGWHVLFGYRQFTRDGDPKLQVTLYHGGSSNSDGFETYDFLVEEDQEALSKYCEILSRII